MRSSAILPLVLSCAAGCSRGDDVSAGDASRPAMSLSTAGSEPRRALRIAPPLGTTQRSSLTTTVSLAMDFEGQHRPGSMLPPMKTTLDAMVSDTRDGVFSTRFVISGAELLDVPGIDEGAAGGLRTELAKQNPAGLTGTTVRDGSGAVRSIDFAPPRGAGAALRQMLGDVRFAVGEMPIVLPNDPFGAGAEWTWTQTGPARDMTITEEARARLVRFEGDRAVISIDSTLRAQSQAIALPGMPKDSRCELLALTGTRKGEITIDPALPLPVAAAIETEMTLDLRVIIKGETKPMAGQVQVKTLWAPR